MHEKISRLRRSVTVLGALVAATLGVIAAAPSAFAMRLVPPEGTAPAVTPISVTHGGMLGWQIALIAIGAALAASVATVVVQRSRRIGLHPAG